MAVDPPVSALLSQLLVAFTIEFDNEFEHQMPHRTARGPAAGSRRGPWLVSMAMWANFMRYIDEEGTAVRNVEGLARLTNLAGLQRWGYVVVEPDPAGGRPDPPRSDWAIRPTPAGRQAQAVWRPLPAVIEARWRERFGAGTVDAVRESLRALVSASDIELPRYLPVLWTGKTDAGDLQGWVRAASARSAGSAAALPHYPMVLHRGGFPDGS